MEGLGPGCVEQAEEDQGDHVGDHVGIDNSGGSN